jgi:hypothetical protein
VWTGTVRNIPGAASIDREVGDSVAVVISRHGDIVIESKSELIGLSGRAIEYVPYSAAIDREVGFLVAGVIGRDERVESG